jgi:hypothetical protein
MYGNTLTLSPIVQLLPITEDDIIVLSPTLELFPITTFSFKIAELL